MPSAPSMIFFVMSEPVTLDYVDPHGWIIRKDRFAKAAGIAHSMLNKHRDLLKLLQGRDFIYRHKHSGKVVHVDDVTRSIGGKHQWFTAAGMMAYSTIPVSKQYRTRRLAFFDALRNALAEQAALPKIPPKVAKEKQATLPIVEKAVIKFDMDPPPVAPPPVPEQTSLFPEPEETAAEPLPDAGKIQKYQDLLIRLPGRPPAMLGKHVAEFYGVKTKRLNEAIERNQERFPEPSLRFQATEAEGVAICDRFNLTRKDFGGSLPWLYTRKGSSAAAFFVKTQQAIEWSLHILDVFDDAKYEGKLPEQAPSLPEKRPSSPLEEKLTIAKTLVTLLEQQLVTEQQVAIHTEMLSAAHQTQQEHGEKLEVHDQKIETLEEKTAEFGEFRVGVDEFRDKVELVMGEVESGTGPPPKKPAGFVKEPLSQRAELYSLMQHLGNMIDDYAGAWRMLADAFRLRKSIHLNRLRKIDPKTGKLKGYLDTIEDEGLLSVGINLAHNLIDEVAT